MKTFLFFITVTVFTMIVTSFSVGIGLGLIHLILTLPPILDLAVIIGTISVLIGLLAVVLK